MKFSEKWGQDVEEATQLALKDLKATIDEVEVTVIEEPSKGFLGLGSKLAKVRVELKSEKDKGEKEARKEVREEPKKPAKAKEKAKCFNFVICKPSLPDKCTLRIYKEDFESIYK